MDLLLTHGYFLAEDPLEQEIMRPYPPLGILYLSSHLERAGFEVGVFDSTFRTRSEFDRELQRERPPVVGFYCNLMTRKTILGMIESARKVGALVVVGGPEPAAWAEEYLDAGADVVVDGEGELTLEELLPHLLELYSLKRRPTRLEGVAGILYRGENGSVVRTAARAKIPDLDDQPFPNRDAIDLHLYVDAWREHHGMGSVSLITARGCPFKCRWCSHGVFGYSHRRRSPEGVADELELILERWKPDMVWYADDVFTINHAWIRAYAEELRKRGLRVPFETISREDRLNEEIVGLLAEMGCHRLWIGSESGSQRVLDRMERQTDAARVREMVRLLQGHGIEAGMFIMLGYEGEELEDLEETLDHLKAAVPDRFLTTLAYPIKGTPYYQEVADRVVARRSWSEGSDRDFTILGRRSDRFYRHATRWMVAEVEAHRLRLRGEGSFLGRMRHRLNANLGRWGMRMTRNERMTG